MTSCISGLLCLALQSVRFLRCPQQFAGNDPHLPRGDAAPGAVCPQMCPAPANIQSDEVRLSLLLITIAHQEIKHNIFFYHFVIKILTRFIKLELDREKKLLCNPSVKFSVILLTIELD